MDAQSARPAPGITEAMHVPQAAIGFRFTSGVTVGTLLTILGVLLSFWAQWTNTQADVRELKKNSVQRIEIEDQYRELKGYLDSIDRRLANIEAAKMDRR